MTVHSFTTEVSEWVAKSKKRTEAVFRGSAQDITEIALLPIAKGGHMPVRTGFLRASGRASTESMPTIDSQANPSDAAVAKFGKTSGATYSADIGQINLVIAGADLGQTIYIGFTASYAKFQEAKHQFVGLAAQRWAEIVDVNVKKAIQAFP